MKISLPIPVQRRTNLLNNLGRSETLWHLNRPLVLPFHLKKDDSLSHISRPRFLDHLRKSDPLLHLRHGEYQPNRKFNLMNRLLKWERDYKLFGIDLNQRKPSGLLALDFTHKLLTYANDDHTWDHSFKYIPVKKLPFEKLPVEVLTDQISKKLSRMNDVDLEFVFSFPYVQDEIDNLIIFLNNSNPSFVQTLVELNRNIDKAFMAKATGLYIPGTDIFVFKEKLDEISSEDLRILTLANKRLEDAGENLQETFFIELGSIENAYAISWKPYGCTQLDWPISSYMSEFDIECGAQFLIHEEAHHRMRKHNPLGFMDDPSLEIDEVKSSYIFDNPNPNEWIEEADAHTRDIERLLEMQLKDLDYSLIKEACFKILSITDALKAPEIIGGISEEGLIRLSRAEERNRRNLLNLPLYACSL